MGLFSCAKHGFQQVLNSSTDKTKGRTVAKGGGVPPCDAGSELRNGESWRSRAKDAR